MIPKLYKTACVVLLLVFPLICTFCTVVFVHAVTQWFTVLSGAYRSSG